MPKKVLIAFGSPSDVKSLPDFPREDNTKYYLSIASAHRTPHMVEQHRDYCDWDGIIAGAGMCNALKDAYLSHADIGTVLVALPLDDKAMRGVSSMLSSSETPPGYPIGMVGLGNLSAAVRFVNYALQPHKKVSLHTRGSTTGPGKAMDDAAKILKRLGVDYQFPAKMEPNTLNLLAYDNPLYPAIIDDVPVICTCSMPIELRRNGHFYLSRLGLYLDGINKHDNYVHVGAANGGNLGLYAAKIVARHDLDVRGRIADLIDEGREKYNDFRAVQRL